MATFRPTPAFQILTRDLVTWIVIIWGTHLDVVLCEAPGFIEARILSVKVITSNSINHSIRKREPRVTVCFDSCATATSAPVSVSAWGLTSQMCAWGSTSHKCTRFEVQKQRTRCTAPVGTGLRRGCQCRPIVILGEFNPVKSVFMSWQTVCKLIVVSFWMGIGSDLFKFMIQMYGKPKAHNLRNYGYP